jgi:hypothetical protein
MSSEARQRLVDQVSSDLGLEVSNGGYFRKVAVDVAVIRRRISRIAIPFSRRRS